MWKLLLQLFAQGEQNPTEEVEASSVDATEEVDFEEGTEEEAEETPETKPQQTKKQNNEYAQKRIKAKEQKLAEEKRKEFLRGVQTGGEGKNRFTGKNIVDEEDLAEFEIMLEMEEKGLDPVEDFLEYTKNKRREAKQAEAQRNQQEMEAEQKTQEDIDRFCEKYGKETAQNLFSNEEFKKFAEGFLGYVPLTVIYEKFTETQAGFETHAEKLVMEKEARRKSSTGGLTETPPPARKSFKDMTREEFLAFQKGIL